MLLLVRLSGRAELRPLMKTWELELGMFPWDLWRFTTGAGKLGCLVTSCIFNTVFKLPLLK